MQNWRGAPAVWRGATERATGSHHFDAETTLSCTEMYGSCAFQMSVFTMSVMWRTWRCTDGGGLDWPLASSGVGPDTARATDMRLERRPTGQRPTDDEGAYFSQ